MSLDYLKMTMRQLSTLLYNASQSDSDSNSIDRVLDSIKRIIQDYNDKVSVEHKIDYYDFRSGRR